MEQSGTGVEIGRLAELSSRLSRCPDLDTLVTATVDGLAELFGYQHCLLLLLDEEATRLYTIASRGYETQGVGSEIPVGEGVIGMAAARCTPIRLGNVGQLSRYGQTVRRAYEDRGDIAPGHQIPFPGLVGTQSRMAVPAMAHGELLGVLVVESTNAVGLHLRRRGIADWLWQLWSAPLSRARDYQIEAPRAAPFGPGVPPSPSGRGPRTCATSRSTAAYSSRGTT